MREMAERLLEVLTNEPKSRDDIKELLSCSDRDVRRAVNELRLNGYNVASSSETKGYWLGNETDKNRTIAELKARAKALIDTADALAKGPDLGQVEVSL